jgi:hypothetical protein
MCQSTFGLFEWTHQIQPHCRKGPGDRYGLKLIEWNVLLASKIFATFTATNQGMTTNLAVWQGGAVQDKMGKSWIPASSLVLSKEGVTGEQGEVCVLPLHSLVEALVRCSGRVMVGEVGGNGGGGKPSLCAMREWTKR